MLEFNPVTVCGFLIFFCTGGISSSRGTSQCGRVHLTVSTLKDTFLELNWITDCNEGDIIPEYIVFSSKNLQDPDEDHEIIKTIKFSEYPNGLYRTSVKFGQPYLPGGWEYDANSTKADPGRHCFPYWIASVRGYTTIDSRCLAIEPTWMSDNSKSIGEMEIGSMFIPGTHNSGSFSGVSMIGYYKTDGFTINHDFIRVTKVGPLFQQIKKFLQLSPKDIVIIDFHRFPYPSNFTTSLHKQFIDLVYKELGEHVLPSTGMESGKGPTLNEIWRTNKNLIISYGEKNIVKDNPWLWHPIKQYWANTIKPSVLKDYLQESIKEHSSESSVNPLWALMAELTPQMRDVILRRHNLRSLARDINGKATKWFRDEWGKQSNIVTTDFFLGSDMINVAISTNSGNSV
ncbi:hypothetical protein JTB14_022836 [Gonioctena quinquepunctata]|nr:hypothetical protein JTB14_022836 [Gonioctena quinquepunctata]